VGNHGVSADRGRARRLATYYNASVPSVDRQRWLDRVLGPPVCWLLTLWQRLEVRSRPVRDVRCILVIALSEMGALVLARPMFERLRERYPGARVSVLSFERNLEALDLLDVVPRDRMLGLRSGSLGAFLVDSIRAIRRVRALSPDVVLDLELFARASAILSALSGAPIRVGFHRHSQEGLYRGDFLNRPVLYNPYQHISDQFVTLAEAIESTTVPTGKRPVLRPAGVSGRLALRPGELDAAREAFQSRFSRLGARPLVFLAPGAGLLPLRAWPIEHYSATAQALAHRGFAIAIVGLAEDGALARTIQDACGTDACVDLTGYTRSVRELAVLLHLGALLIANDGGIAHFASLVQIPAIVLYGPETPTLYGSMSPGAVNLHRPLSCSPCLTAYNHRRSPCDGDNVCLKSIAPSEVLGAAYRMLGVSTPA
jgi:ADP-heptose:LPS heptosyltransferase